MSETSNRIGRPTVDDQQLDEKEIFNAALQLESAEARQAYLRSACGSRPDVRERVSLLLQLEAEPTSFLETPVAGVVATLAMSPPVERTGTTIGRYKLRELLGEGGMGSVYVAEQTEPVRRKVALKIIKPGMASADVVARFGAERQALSMMDHANIARVMDGGTTESGLPYFVMELVRGVPITEYCDHHRLPTRARLEIFQLVCRAVQHAHQKGIIHRDLKPSNVLVAEIDGAAVPKVIDFGVAKAINQNLSESTVYTQFSQMVGTPLYMSPEQAGAGVVDIDTRSDVYSLGVLLYELLTGTTPFDRETLKQAGFDEMRRMIREVDPPRPSARVSTLNAACQSTLAARHQLEPHRFSQFLRGELDWIVLKAIEKDRNRRYATANGLAEDVSRYLNDEPVDACPPSLVYRFRKSVRKHRILLTTLALVIATMLIGTGASIWQAVRATRAEIKTDEQRVLAEVSADEARRQTSDALIARAEALNAKQEADAQRNEADRHRNAVSRHLYFADIRLGLVDWKAGNIGRLSSKLLSHEPQLGVDDQRGWEWYYLLGAIHEDERTLMQHAAQVDSVRWSPDRRYLASTCSQGLVRVYDATTWRLIRTWKTEHIWGGTWSPDSIRFAWSTTGPDDKCYVGNVAIGDMKPLKGHLGKTIPEWSRDGKYLASAGADGIRIWDSSSDSSFNVLARGTQTRGTQRSSLPSPGKAPYRNLAWDHEGRLLYLPSNSNVLRTWAAGSEEDAQGVPFRKGWNATAWSPDGQHLAVGTESGTCHVYKTSDWSLTAQWQANAGSVWAVAWHPEGTQIATSGADNLINLWEPETGRNLLTLRGHVDQVISLDWESSGLRLASGGMEGLVKVWSLPLSPQPRQLVGHAGGAQDIVWSEDGANLRSIGTIDGNCTLWDVDRGERISEYKSASGRFSASGKLLAVASPDTQQLEFRIHDAATGDIVKTVENKTASPSTWAFSPDDSKLAILSNNKLEILDLRSRESIFNWSGQGNTAIAWSPDGKSLARVGQGDTSAIAGYLRHAAWLHIFDVGERQQVSKMQHGSNWTTATAVCWNPNGLQVASGDNNGVAEIWELSSDRKSISVQLHTGKINALAWSPNTQRIASGGTDGTIRIWDPASGEELLKLDTHSDGLTHVAWSPNGERLMGTTADGVIRIWDATLGYQYFQSETYAHEVLKRRLDYVANHWDVGRTDEFIDQLNQTAQLAGPNNSAFPHWVTSKIRDLAMVAVGRGQFDDAMRIDKAATRISKDETNRRSKFAYALSEAGQCGSAITVYESVLAEADNDVEVLNNFAWILATCPDAKFRDPARAVALAEKACDLTKTSVNDGSSQVMNSLGVAQYRADMWSAAVATLNKSVELGRGGNSYDYLFLAMSHWRLDHKAEARLWYDKAVAWMAKNAQTEELIRFRSEAAVLLELDAP